MGHENEDLAIGLNSLAEAEESARRFRRRRAQITGRHCELPGLLDYPEGVAYITGNLAELALGPWGLVWTAETLAREALAFSEKVGRQELIAFDCRRLAMALVRQGKKTSKPFTYAQRAVEIFTRLGSPELIVAHQHSQLSAK